MPQYTPDRNHIIWLDFEPPRGKEIGKYRPALVLSSRAHNQKTGLLICCPISSSIRGTLTEVPVKGLEKPSVVASNIIQTMSWKHRSAKLITEAEEGVLDDVLLRIVPLIGADQAIEQHLGAN